MSAAPVRLAALGLAVALGAAVWLVTRPGPSLAPAVNAFNEHRFDDADRLAREYLKAAPSDPWAILLVAQIDLEGPGHSQAKSARDALEHLRRFHSDRADLATYARFYEGEAEWTLLHYDRSEAAWREALKLDPGNAKAGWRLLKLYDLQGRDDERRVLGERLFNGLLDTGDRVRVLLELVRADVHRQAAIGVIDTLRPVVAANPDDLHSTLALGRALVREGRHDEGLERLRRAVALWPVQSFTWEAWLAGLVDAGRPDELSDVLEQLPADVSESPRIARYRGWLAQSRGDAKTAALAYRRAVALDPNDSRLHYRLGRVLQVAGLRAESADHLAKARALDEALEALRRLYDREHLERWDGTIVPALFQQIAELREQMGRHEQARDWYRLVLQAEPGNAASESALRRLEIVP